MLRVSESANLAKSRRQEYVPCVLLMSLSPAFSMELRFGALRREDVEDATTLRPPALGELLPVDDLRLF